MSTTGTAALTAPDGPLAATERDEAMALADDPQPGREAPEQGTVYVIQRQVGWEAGDVGGPNGWTDVGRVMVPKRSSLKTVFDTALEELQELKPTEASGPRRLRAFQPADVAEWEALLEVPPAPVPQVVVRPA